MNTLNTTLNTAPHNEVMNAQVTPLFAFVTKVTESMVAKDIDQEVAGLLEVARNEIGRFEAMDEWLADNLATLQVVVDGSVVIKYTDSRKFVQYKQQSLSDAFWVIANKQLQYHLSVNYDLLSTAFANWINDNVYTEAEVLGKSEYTPVTTTAAELVMAAKMYLTAMQDVDLIGKNLIKKTVRLQAGNNITSKVYEITPEFKELLNTIITELRDKVSMKCRPLQFKPNDWLDMYTGIAEGAGIKLVARAKTKTPKIAPAVLSAVNKLQSVKFTLAKDIISAAHDMSLNASVYKMDVYKHLFKDKEVNKEAFELYTEVTTVEDKEFYFPVTLDARGRMYYRGGLLSPQGVDFCKAAFQFASFKPLGESGFNAIAMHTANVCGFDKVSTNDRLSWVRSNWETIMNIQTHMDIRTQFKGASVFQALVACRELQRLARLDGEWSERTSNLVCHMDGTCNGLQHMAAITGDRATAVAVNCTASSTDDVPADVYGIVAHGSEEFAVGQSLELIRKFGRDGSKDAVMVTSYGASESTVINNVGKYIVSKGSNIVHAKDIGEAYLSSISKVAGAVTQLTQALTVRVGLAVTKGAKKIVWRTADGFIASTKYEDEESMVVRAGLFHVRKRNMGTAPLDGRKTVQAMAPNFVHSIDATHLRMVVNACNHELVTVHDSIGSHAGDYFETYTQVRKQFVEVHEGYDALADLCKSLNQPVPKFPREGDYKASEALQSAYIFS